MSKASHLKLNCEVSQTEKVRLCFRVVDDVPEKKGMDLWKQMSSSKCSFTCICGIFLPLNPSTTTVYAWSAFYPSLRFTLSLQPAFYTQSAFYPWSAVSSPQSAVRSLRFTLTGKIFSTETNINSLSLPCLSSSEQYSSPTVFWLSSRVKLFSSFIFLQCELGPQTGHKHWSYFFSQAIQVYLNYRGYDILIIKLTQLLIHLCAVAFST